MGSIEDDCIRVPSLRTEKFSALKFRLRSIDMYNEGARFLVGK